MLVDLLEEGFRIYDVASTRDHVSITLRRGRERESLTFDREETARLLSSGLLEPASEAAATRDTLDLMIGLLSEGFSVTDVSSTRGRLAVTLRLGRDRETLVFDGETSRLLAQELLEPADPPEAMV